ncbi:DUF4145 domain-containing protein [Duganella sp. HH105]|uniref:DUF4145 domain-containing protein n=1 Tax=Duganella sp. HH105 TaxID=1781067 RepID=UPI000892D85E|nr:DUF4145 domain-containing protein [Duganella sp. HH105]OEZ62097.1 hypothetical protein DUGA6_17820 [Duganella sp. HH105]
MTTHTDLLEDLIERSDFGSAGVDRLRYRADHSSEISAIDTLERTGMIRVEGTLSFITLLAMAELDTQDSARFFVTAERLYGSLASRYKTAPGAPVLIGDLATELGLGFVEAFRCICLMAECYLCNNGFSGPQAINNPEQAQISPAESILRYPTFRDCVLQIQAVRVQSAASTSDLWNSLAFPAIRPTFSAVQQTNEFAVGLPVRLKNALPEIQANLLSEVYLAINHKLLTLASMGLRAMIDMVCVEQVGDKGNFREKLTALHKLEIISNRQLGVLLTVIDAGNASAHRGFTPDESDIDTVLDVVEHLLSSVYVHPKGAAELAKNTPTRQSK